MKAANLSVVLTVVLAACGDDLADNGYQGEPLATVHGSLQIEPTDRPNDTLQVALIWNVEADYDFKYNQDIQVDGDALGEYEISVLVPPPDLALNTDPLTGGRIGFAWIMAYDDPRGEGPLDLTQLDPKDYPTLMYRWRGGSPDVLLAYARDAFPAGHPIAEELGQPIEPGFYLVHFEGECYCYPGTHGMCVDDQGESCARNDLVLLPMDAEVDLHIVDDLVDFRMVHPPDWLFL